MLTSQFIEKSINKEGKLDFAADAAIASLIAGAIYTPVLHKIFVDEYQSLLQTIRSVIWDAGEIFIYGLPGFLVGGLVLRILIYFLFYSKLDENEKTARTLSK